MWIYSSLVPQAVFMSYMKSCCFFIVNCWEVWVKFCGTEVNLSSPCFVFVLIQKIRFLVDSPKPFRLVWATSSAAKSNIVSGGISSYERRKSLLGYDTDILIKFCIVYCKCPKVFLFIFCVCIVKLKVVCLILAEWNASIYAYSKKLTN